MAAKLLDRKLIAAAVGSIWFSAALLASPHEAAANGWGHYGGGWYPHFGFAFGPYPYAYYPPVYYPPNYSYYPYYPYGAYTPPPAWQPPVAAAVPPPPEGQNFIVMFHFDQASLNRDARDVLDQVVEQAMRIGAPQIQVSGYTDNPGTSPYNQALSERRASAVRDYLVARGIAYDHVVAQGFGKENPRVPTPEGAREAQNRRVEISILPSPNVAYGPAAPTCQTVQTMMSVNGRQEPAYGRACRQPDGTWKIVP
jgi:outer membrane protein OmpA-like peptidoglycan-associated protein